MELEMITESVGFLTTRVKVGVVSKDKSCVLIDSGLDSSTGKKILSKLRREGLNVVGIIDTHSHADHYGGTAFIQERTGARVYASAIEAAIIENPVLEPIYFAGGAHPPMELRNKFMMGKACRVDQIVEEGPFEVGSIPLEIVGLPGHSPQQIGVIAEGVMFCADSVFPTDVLEKHGILFLHNVGDFRNSLEKLLGTSCDHFLPSHGELTNRKELGRMVQANLSSTERVEEIILESLDSPRPVDRLIAMVLNRHGMRIESYSDYHLFSSTIKAYLTYLQEVGRIEFRVKGNLPTVYPKRR